MSNIQSQAREVPQEYAQDAHIKFQQAWKRARMTLNVQSSE